MDQPMPKRIVEADRMHELLREYLPSMEAVVQSRRVSVDAEPPLGPDRELKRCVAVLVWQEPDGSECTEVVGDATDSPLHMKGLLHDGVYLLAHAGEEGFTPH